MCVIYVCVGMFTRMRLYVSFHFLLCLKIYRVEASAKRKAVLQTVLQKNEKLKQNEKC